MKIFLIAFVCLVVIVKVVSKVAPTSGKVIRGTSTEITKSNDWSKFWWINKKI